MADNVLQAAPHYQAIDFTVLQHAVHEGMNRLSTFRQLPAG
jgi:hypothetical protein